MKKKIIGIIVVVLAVLALGFVGFIIGENDEEIVKVEADKIGKLETFNVDEIDMEIKSKGDYAVVEQTMKEYVKEIAIVANEITEIMYDEKLGDVLKSDNYKKDGPDFKETKEYISTTKTSFNEKMDKLISLIDEESMMKAIENKNLEQKYIDFYREVMIGNDGATDNLKETVEAIKENQTVINTLFDTQEKVINFLIENKGKWEINSENQIEFSTQALVNQYNEIVSVFTEQ